MDDEGLEPQRTTLIENGVLKAFLSDRAGEWRTGQPRTGGAQAMRSPLPAGCATPSSLLVPSPADLIGSIDNGLYCMMRRRCGPPVSSTSLLRRGI